MVLCLGWEDLLEKGIAAHSSIMAWRLPWSVQYSGLENSMDSIVHGITKSRTQLSDFHFHFSIFMITVVAVQSLSHV